jgi:hypothetical protein
MMTAPASARRARKAIVRELESNGFMEQVMSSGPELDRLKAYLEILAERREGPSAPGQAPVIFPPFPGLDEKPWRDASTISVARALEQQRPAIERDLARLEQQKFFSYDADIVSGGEWSVHPVFFAGERVDTLFLPEQPMDETVAVIESLEGECSKFPLADVLFSAHAPGTKLTPHCSWDGFRMRLHLGLRIPEGCGIRVGDESREWSEGRVLVFHDSFEHETWNNGTGRRVVLIVDCWHPGLTLAEREALMQMTRKRGVRSVLAGLRVPAAMLEQLEARFED